MSAKKTFWNLAGLGVGIYAANKMLTLKNKRRKKKTPKKARK